MTVTARPESTPDLRSFLGGPVHQAFKTMSGIVSREVYGSRDRPETFLVVPTWASLTDLERVRATDALRMDQVHEQLKTTIVAFTGALAAGFSALTSRPSEKTTLASARASRLVRHGDGAC